MSDSLLIPEIWKEEMVRSIRQNNRMFFHKLDSAYGDVIHVPVYKDLDVNFFVPSRKRNEGL